MFKELLEEGQKLRPKHVGALFDKYNCCELSRYLIFQM